MERLVCITIRGIHLAVTVHLPFPQHWLHKKNKFYRSIGSRSLGSSPANCENRYTRLYMYRGCCPLSRGLQGEADVRFRCLGYCRLATVYVGTLVVELYPLPSLRSDYFLEGKDLSGTMLVPFSSRNSLKLWHMPPTSVWARHAVVRFLNVYVDSKKYVTCRSPTKGCQLLPLRT